MMSKSLAFTGMSLNRASTLRKSPRWLNERLAAENSIFIPIYQGKYLVLQQNVIQLTRSFDLLDELLALAEQPIFLGLDESSQITAHFVIDLSFLPEKEYFAFFQGLLNQGQNKQRNEIVENELVLADFRTVLPSISSVQAATLSYAKSLSYWHQTHQFCGCCGNKTELLEAGHMRQCINEQCNKQNFPRTDPVVIMLIEYQPEHGPAVCLLANHVNSPDNLVSTLAGFVDPGESLEEAVKREVYEEAGISVENIDTVDYIASQPWPFPCSLMVGFFVKATSSEISIDKQELSTANWYSAEQVRCLNDWGDKAAGIQIPRQESIARFLIDTWLEQQA